MANGCKQVGIASETNPVFVVGIFRSGTSLLYALLNQHPQIALMFECNVFEFPEVLSKRRFNGNWLERQEFYNKALSRHRLIFANRLAGLENVRTPEDLYRVYGDGKQAQLVGEKSPPYCKRLRQLARRYPNASFILIWRDPVETYRSIREAARSVPFFERIGVSRFVFAQEQMVRQAAELTFAGKRMHHVRYGDLVDRPEEICRGVCQFLNIAFEKTMLNLANADLSATHQNHRRQLHTQLSGGVIARRKDYATSLNPEVVQRVQQFHARWHRLVGRLLPNPVSTAEPPVITVLYHRALGRMLYLTDNVKRALLEFLPLSWLKAYRRTKTWFFKGQPASSDSLGKEFAANRITILVSCLLLASICLVDLWTPPGLVLMPFYLIPSMLLALIVNARWGMLAAVATTLLWNGAGIFDRPELASNLALFAWNGVMRFLALEFIVLLVNRIRLEVASPDYD